MIIFTKTGSGQTSEKLKKEYRFSYRLPVQWQASLPKEALPRRRLEDAFRALSAGRPHALGDRAAGARLGLREPRLYQLAQGLLPPFGAQKLPPFASGGISFTNERKTDRLSRQTRDKHQKTEQKRSVFAHNHAAGSVRVQ